MFPSKYIDVVDILKISIYRCLHRCIAQHYKVCPHLYANANEACGTEASEPERMAKSGLFGIRLVKRTPALRMYFFLSTNSKQIAIGSLPNIRHTNECCSQRLGYMSTSTFLSFPHASFGIQIQMWVRLYSLWEFGY